MGSVKPDEKVKKYDTRTQPAFHEANKSFFEKFCNCCIAQNEKNELTRQEVSFHNVRFNGFRSITITSSRTSKCSHMTRKTQITSKV